MLNEARTMINLSHAYLVYLYGITRYDNQFCLITKYILNRSLLFWLQQQQQRSSLTLDYHHRLQLFSFQICDVMSCLISDRNCLFIEI
jgi:serine/threonine protein kinase